MTYPIALLDALAELRARPLSPTLDPWDPYATRPFWREPLLTSVEVTATNRCNLRCEHCAVGDLLTAREGSRLPVDLLVESLAAVPTLLTFSVTGGEPSLGADLVQGFLLPLLQAAKASQLRTQVNTNLTQPLSQYLSIAPWVDVFHISFNYADAQDFHDIAFARAPRAVDGAAAARLFERMVANMRALGARGAFVSAETILTGRTAHQLAAINRYLAGAGVRRHEIHPLYPSDFAASLPLLDRRALRASIETFLTERDPGLWALFGTLPFFACNPDGEERELVWQLLSAPNVTVRNDPDGRNRLNVHGLSGDVFVQDFADLPPLGNVRQSGLIELFDRWLAMPDARRLHCHCPEANCLGPNGIVAATYYPGIDFRERRAIMPALA